MDGSDVINMGLGLLGVVLSLYPIVKEKLLSGSRDDYENQISRIGEYSKPDGYKALINDCFLLLFYAFSMLCVSTGVFVLSIRFLNIEFLRTCATSFYGGLIIGVGIGCYYHYKLLYRAKKPDESIPDLESKVEKINKKIRRV